MPPLRSDQPLIPSILDRLLDDEPSVSREAPKSRTQVLRDLKQSVRRDLESLLNTRRRCVACPPDFTELDKSLVAYGLPDIAGMDLSTPDSREEFRWQMEQTIRTFEPRFKTVTVTLLDKDSPVDRTLRFRIDGMLRVDPSPEPVAFDSSLEPATGSIEIRGTTA